MVVRSLVVLGVAAVVALTTTWLPLLGRAFAAQSVGSTDLAFSVYWVIIPAALMIAFSWVYEMRASGSNQTELQEILATGGFNLGSEQAQNSERRTAIPAAGTAPAASGSTVSVWKRLETDFREILEFGADLDATWKRVSSYADATETWTLSGSYEEQRIAKKFDELADTAGRMLVEWPGYTPPLSASTMKHRVERERWLIAIRDREIKTETWAPGQVTESGAVTGHVHGGVIHEVIEASIEFCIQLTLEESLENPAGADGESLGARLILPEAAS